MNSVNNIQLSRLIFFKRARILPPVLFFLLAFAAAASSVKAQPLIENFDDISMLWARGWFMRNNSNPVGLNWFQGNPDRFPAQSGAPNSYIGANYGSTSGSNTISNWLFSPRRPLNNGDTVTFWTRTISDSQFPDRLEVRLSPNGASINVGNTPTSVGDFTRLLLAVNPNLEVSGYPEVWTRYKIILSGLPRGGVSGRIAFRYFVTSGGPMGINSDYIGIDNFSINPLELPPPEAPLDFNGDNKTDYVVVRNTGGGDTGSQMTWFISTGATRRQADLGVSGDFFLAGDFDGDDVGDITVYRPSASSFFYTLRSGNGTLASVNLGVTGDLPTVVGDYDGDDTDDYAVYRRGAAPGQPSIWAYRGSGTNPGGGNGITFVQWGYYGDTPAPGDYDGDGINDFCVRENDGNGRGLFQLKKSGGGVESVFWGSVSDLIVPGDYDGDWKTDIAVVRADGAQLLWSVLGRSSNNVIHYGEPWGLAQTDFPVQGDYDGDGKTDIAVWRPSAEPAQTFFYVRKSSDGALQAFQWGQRFDYPLAYFNSH